MPCALSGEKSGAKWNNRLRAGEGEKLLCTWREACKTVDYVLEHFSGEGASDAQDRAETSAALEVVNDSKMVDASMLSLQQAEVGELNKITAAGENVYVTGNMLFIGLQAGDGASAEYETLHIPITFVISC